MVEQSLKNTWITVNAITFDFGSLRIQDMYEYDFHCWTVEEERK